MSRLRQLGALVIVGARIVFAATIWAPGAIPRAEAKYATPLKRVVLPFFDATVIALGILGIQSGGFKALQLALPAPMPVAVYAAIAIAAVVCLAGVSFPRLWFAEIAGKTTLVALLTLLGVSLIVAGSTVPGHAGLVAAPMVSWGITIALLRLWILGREIAKRKTGEPCRNG